MRINLIWCFWRVALKCFGRCSGRLGVLFRVVFWGKRLLRRYGQHFDAQAAEYSRRIKKEEEYKEVDAPCTSWSRVPGMGKTAWRARGKDTVQSFLRWEYCIAVTV